MFCFSFFFSIRRRHTRWTSVSAFLLNRSSDLVCFSSNYELYADMSNRMMSTLEELSPRVDIYSIDEAFCDLTGVRNCRDLTDFGRSEERRVGKECRSGWSPVPSKKKEAEQHRYDRKRQNDKR